MDSNRPSNRIRLIARIIGTLIVAFWLLMSIGYAFGSPDEPWTWESSIMTTLIAVSTTGPVIGWKRELAGGTILVLCAIAHSTFALFVAGHNQAFTMLISGGPVSFD